MFMQYAVDLVIEAPRIVTCAPGERPRRGASMRELGVVEDAAMAVRDGRIAWVGPRAEAAAFTGPRVAVASHRCIVPGLVDAHTHPVWGGSRVDEFIRRANGETYLDIHRSGGGISATVRATRALSREAVATRTQRVLSRMLAHGSTTVEAKSGYGLDLETELRDLSILREVSQVVPMQVVPTFLGAHALPPEHAERREAFVDLVAGEMLDRVAAAGLAEFCDVFCEDGAFTLDESRRILESAARRGLKLKIHAEEFAYLGGARMAAALGATSCDHLLRLPASDFEALAQSRTVAVLLPATTFFLGKDQYAPAREMIDAGVAVAVATDFNAGSCMTESLPAALSVALLRLRLLPEEAIVAGTVNAAHAVGRGSDCGSLETGKRADFLVLDIADPREWLYHFGTNLVAEVWTGGVRRVCNSAPAPLAADVPDSASATRA